MHNQTYELIDSLPGSGKTTAILKYMADNRSNPWLYISPMKEEVENRVPNEALQHGLELFYPSTEGDDRTKTEQVLEFLEEGLDICCTHNLMHRFTKLHLEALKKRGYNIVCDETLDLIQGYPIAKGDMDFLKLHNHIEIEPESGKVSFADQTMSADAKYADFKTLCDLGCLFVAGRSDRMLVTQLSTNILSLANRFILITYNYKGSIMESFLNLQGYTYTEMQGLTLYRSNSDCISALKDRLEFVETPSVYKIQEGKDFSKLSKSWWLGSSSKERDEIFKAMKNIVRNSGFSADEYFFTLPKDVLSSSKYSVPPKTVSDKSWVVCNARSTNNYQDRRLAIHAYNLFPNIAVTAYLQDRGCRCDSENYALNMLIQWLYRGCIRKSTGEKMQIAILSRRMSIMFKKWLLEKTSV